MSATVLLVATSPAVLFTLEAALEGTGLATVACHSGQEALGSWRAWTPLVTDLVMPGMDGLLALMGSSGGKSHGYPDLPVGAGAPRAGSEKVAVAAIRQGAYDT
jgi:CheY-like chemotaxis protein